MIQFAVIASLLVLLYSCVATGPVETQDKGRIVVPDTCQPMPYCVDPGPPGGPK